MFKKSFPWGKVTMALFVGAAAGAVTALLLTPNNGKEMQKQLKVQAENVEKAVKKFVA